MKTEERIKLLRQVEGRELQTMQALPEDPSKVKCFCCEQLFDIDKAGKQFYDDFKGILRCDKCGSSQVIASERHLTEFFSAGFPQCCGETMRWVTQYELEKELP